MLYINTIWGHVSMELNCVQTMRKSKVYVHDTTLRSQNAEQLRENGWLLARVSSFWLVPACIELGSTVTWIQLGSSLDPAGIQLGYSLDPAWIQP